MARWEPWSEGIWIDLTHSLRPGDAVYPGDPVLEYQPHATLESEGYRLTRLTLGTHLGTHVDAPSHYLPDGATVEALPLDGLCGPAIVVDVPGEPGGVIEAARLEAAAGELPSGARVLLRSGWDRYYPQTRYYEEHPGLSVDAARWLVERGVRLVGFDTPSPSLDTQRVHEVLLGARRPTILVESLANLGRLPRNVYLTVMPLKLAGADGAPARVAAWVPRLEEATDSARHGQ